MNWLRKMMYGRYGTDQLSFALLILSMILLVVTRFTNLAVFSLLGFCVLVLSYLRIFSRNTYKRYGENQKFLQIWGSVKQWWQGLTRGVQERKTHRHYKCPNCAQKIRVPKGRGKICITCPQCRSEFVKKT